MRGTLSATMTLREFENRLLVSQATEGLRRVEPRPPERRITVRSHPALSPILIQDAHNDSDDHARHRRQDD